MTQPNISAGKCCSLLRGVALVIIIAIFDYYVIHHAFQAPMFPTPILVLIAFTLGFMNGVVWWVVKQIVGISHTNQPEN